jgi:multidrug efflux pump subunit AcrB
MTHGQSDQEIIQKTHNVARYFTETRQIAWVLLVATLFWGLYAYYRMPQRKDPDIPVRQAVALISWPGANAEKVEKIITRRVEEKIAENAAVERIESTSQNGGSLIYITLSEKAKEPGKEFDDIKLKMDSLQELPQGAGPIQFIKDFGDTAALMLTVASPRADGSEIAVRAQAVRQEDLSRPPGRGWQSLSAFLRRYHWNLLYENGTFLPTFFRLPDGWPISVGFKGPALSE